MKKPASFLVLLFACASSSALAKPSRFVEERNIREAAFRYQMREGAGRQHQENLYFLAIGPDRTDPSDEFMKRFVSHKPPVKKVSQSTRVEHGVVVDKVTGKKGLLLCSRGVKWLGPAKAEVAGEYNASNLGGSWNTFILEKRRGKWIVTKDIQGVLS